MNALRRKLALAAAAALLLLQPACSSDSEETAETYIQTVTNECSLAGGTVTTSGENNCDYQAVVTATTGQTVASTDTTSQTAIQYDNARVSEVCEYAAQLKSVQCQLDRLSSETSQCRDFATQAAQNLAPLLAASGTGSVDGVVSALTGLEGGDACQTELKNAYLTYMTALNGSLANSREGCAILEAGVGKWLRNYQGMVSAGQLAKLLSLGESVASALGGSCPAAAIFRSFLTPSQTAASSVATTTPESTASEEAAPAGYRVFRDGRIGGFPVVY